MLVKTTIRFIEDALPLPGVRALAERRSGPDPSYIAAAGELGWFGLLVDESLGGSNPVSGARDGGTENADVEGTENADVEGADAAVGSGLLDAAAVAAERGAGLQPGPFVGTSVVALALSTALAEARTESPKPSGLLGSLARLMAGQAAATWVVGAGGSLAPRTGEITIRRVDGGYILDGEVRHVADAAGCELLLVTGDGPDGLTQLLVDTGTAGVETRQLTSLDVTRQTYVVRLNDVHVPVGAVVGTPGAATEAQVARQVAVAAVLAAAESIGAMHRDFEMAVDYARARIAFGRPIGSFQAVKHLLADTSLTLEMAKGLVAAAADALAAGAPDATAVAHAAKAFVAEHGITLTHSCFQVFGGIGYTWEHDHHLFMRRLTADAAAHGSADWHRARLAERIGAA